MSRYIDADALIDEFEWCKQQAAECNRKEWDEIITRVSKQPTVDAVPVDFINQKIVELQSCASQHFDDGHKILATCVWETIRLLGSFLKEWRGKEQADE